jgi:hypothetical protein
MSKKRNQLEEKPIKSLSNPLSLENPFRNSALYPKGFPDPLKPVVSALIEAEMQTTDHLFCELISPTSLERIKSSEDKIIWTTEFGNTAERWNELLKWIPLKNSLSDEERNKWLMAMLEANLPELFWKPLIDKKKRVGRPVSKRHIFIQSLEELICHQDNSPSWNDLAIKFCDCKKSKHDDRCRESLKHGVGRLMDVLKAHCEGFWQSKCRWITERRN